MSANRNSNGGEVFALFCVVALVVVAYIIYSFVKATGDAVGLSWGPTAYLIGGAVTCLAGIAALWYFELNPKLNAAIFVPVMYVFALPALNEKAVSPHARIFADQGRYSFGSLYEPAWYGSGWWQFAMFIAIAALVAWWYYYNNDRY